MTVIPHAADLEIASINRYFEDLRVGHWLTTRARTITETDLVMFSGLSGDYSSIHVDDRVAAKSPFGQKIAHGCLTLSVATGLEFQTMCGERENHAIAFYGLDKVRFTKPVRVGDTIHLQIEVIGLEDKGPKGGVVVMQQCILNELNDIVVSFEKRTLNAKRKP